MGSNQVTSQKKKIKKVINANLTLLSKSKKNH